MGARDKMPDATCMGLGPINAIAVVKGAMVAMGKRFKRLSCVNASVLFLWDSLRLVDYSEADMR
jgi:hypothetical protein